MKRFISMLALMCCFLLTLSGCSTKYKRITFANGASEEKLARYVDENTAIVNNANGNLPSKLPVYRISERNISKKEFQQTLEQLGIEEGQGIELKGNVIEGTLIEYTDTSHGDFNMSNEELNALAWETLNKLSIIEGTYECLDKKSVSTLSGPNGTITTRVGLFFCRVLDDTLIMGSDQCDLYFDNSGLVEIFIKLYDYEKINTIDLVPLKDASSRIKSPDYLCVDPEETASDLGVIDTFEVKNVVLRYYNQYFSGRTVLQPVYKFSGTVTDRDGKQTEFFSLVIAIPDSYTYEDSTGGTTEGIDYPPL